MRMMLAQQARRLLARSSSCLVFLCRPTLTELRVSAWHNDLWRGPGVSALALRLAPAPCHLVRAVALGAFSVV